MRDWHVFMSQSVEILNVSNTLTLKQIFWKTNFFSQKLEYSFLVESTKIENASFPYKTAMSEANVKTNRIVQRRVQIGPITKSGLTTSLFWKFGFSLRISYKELFWYTGDPNVHIHTFSKGWNFIWWWFFLVSILKSFRNAL